MNDSVPYTSAIARCEAAARNHGHTLGIVWYPVDERLHACLCEVCGAMGWVTRPGGEKHWRIGGSVLEQDCLEDDKDRHGELEETGLLRSLVVLHSGRFLKATSQGNLPPALAFKESSR